jgi:hypothetical protein
MHHDRLAAMSTRLHVHKSLGAIRRVNTSFAFPADEAYVARDIRFKPTLEPLGSLGDLGWCGESVVFCLNSTPLSGNLLTWSMCGYVY